MKYKEIISISGMPGLYQLVTTKSDGIIIRTMDDGKAKFISARSHNFTPLESIEVFTTGDNVPLSEIFKAMQEKDAEFSEEITNSPKEIKSYFKNIYPELDEDRVYVSDMKKMLKWYPILKEKELLHFEEEEEKEEEKSEKE